MAFDLELDAVEFPRAHLTGRLVVKQGGEPLDWQASIVRNVMRGLAF